VGDGAARPEGIPAAGDGAGSSRAVAQPVTRQALLKLEATAARNAEHNVGLSDEEVLAIIEQAREEIASAAG